MNKRTFFLAAVALMLFAANLLAQDTAYVPFKVNANATVKAQQGTESVSINVTANMIDTLLIISEIPSALASPGRTQKPVTVYSSRGKLSLELSPQFYKNAEISLYSLNGKRVLHYRVNALETAKNISHPNIATGVYVLHVKEGGKTFSTRLAHHGGGMNIDVSFGGISPLKKEESGTFGAWNITVSAEGYSDSTYTFSPMKGINELQNITLRNKCGEVEYNPKTHFCQEGTNVVKPLCKGKTYPATEFCKIAARDLTFDDIQYWVGQGPDSAMFIVQWNDALPPDGLVWGYLFDANNSNQNRGINIIYAVAKEDPRFFALSFSTDGIDPNGNPLGVAIGGLGYDINENGIFKLILNNALLSPNSNGLFITNSYNFDDYAKSEPEDHWQSGWYDDGYWSYWVTDIIGSQWEYSNWGASSRVLKNKSVDAWYFDIDAFTDYEKSTFYRCMLNEEDCDGADYFGNITPITKPLSSSSVDNPSSSSSDTDPSSSSVDNSSSSSSFEKLDCTGFTDGTERVHEGKSKKQFCDIRDGTKYVYVDIGSQTWMAENLNYSGENGKMGRCFRDDPKNCEALGRMYKLDDMFCSSDCDNLQWGVADPEDLKINIACPVGWHLPSTTEVEELWTYSDPNFVAGSETSGRGKNSAATKLKAAGWGDGTDELGFSGLPGGFCGGGCPATNTRWTTLYNSTTADPIRSTFWWSHAYGAPVPLAKSWHMETATATVDDAFQSFSTSAFYVRCLKDKTPSLKKPEPVPQTINCSGNGTAGQKCHFGKWKDYFTDSRDGKEYPYVKIGDKTWMAANLNFAAEDGSKCYNDLGANCDIYGRLYSWRAAMGFPLGCTVSTGGTCPAASTVHQGTCPVGWHLPTHAEWTALTTAIGGLTGTAAKLKAGSGWNDSNINGINGTDNYGFAALPGGYGNFSAGNASEDNFRGVIEFGIARGGFWWSTTRSAANGAQSRHIGLSLADINSIDNDVSRLYSVRCVKD